MKRVSIALAVCAVLVVACKPGVEPGPRPTTSQSPIYPAPAPMPTVVETPTAPVIMAAHAVGKTHTQTPSKPPSESASPMPKKPPTTPRPNTPKPSTKPVPKSTTKPPATTAAPVPKGNVLTIGGWSHSYVTAFGSQKAVDSCAVVEWDTRWFVGHNYCGYQFWASLGIGTTITLSGKDAGIYRVTDRMYLPYQGGKAPVFTQKFDLVLQTCKGSGTQLVFAQKIG